MLNKSIILSLLCNLFHYYAFSVYAFSSIILAPIFFPTDNIELTKLLGLVTLSLMLLLRPLGNILFGHIGDKHGRKASLMASLVAITIATLGIGLIPSYSSIGVLSSVILIMGLSVQGICMGGQFTGAIIFIQEHMKKKNASFACGLMVGIGFVGVFLGTATSFLFHNLQDVEWGWRLPFLCAPIFGIILIYLMKHMEESPLFIQDKLQENSETVPLLKIIKNHKRAVCASIFISSVPISMFYLATVYFPNFYGMTNGDNKISNPLLIVCFAQVLCMIFTPLFGHLADRVGKEVQLKMSSILLIIMPIFLFYFMGAFNNAYGLILSVVVSSLFVSLFSGPYPAFLSENFPVIGRCSGLGIGVSLGEGIIGGASPLICVALEQIFDSQTAPAYFIMCLGLMSLSGIMLLKKERYSLAQTNQQGDMQVDDLIQENLR